MPDLVSFIQKNLKFLSKNKQYYYPEGHFYSPSPSFSEIKSKESEIWKEKSEKDIQALNMNTEEQLLLVKEFQKYYKELPFGDVKKENQRYYFSNPYYTYTDGIILYSIMRHFKPSKIVEVGSGFSSALMLDVNNLFFNNSMKLSFVEPYPERLYTLISKEDKQNTEIIEKGIQEVDLQLFKSLKANDVLFIDSTHVAKTGSDVNHIFFEILPVLQSGVIIHFHDVFWPFEYPKHWVLGGRAWNEDYLLRAFMMYNSSYEILLFSHFIHQRYKEAFAEMPLLYKNQGGNIWLRKN